MRNEIIIKPGDCSAPARKLIAGDGWRYDTCSRKATVEREGKGYCKQHDPVRRKELQDEKEKKWRAERATYRERVARRSACFEALEGWADPSAAGQVLESLEDVLAGYDSSAGSNFDGGKWAKRARAAIAKAKGKS